MTPNTAPHADEVLIILDTETTGLDHKTEKIIEIAAAKMVNGEVTETFTSLVNPEKPIRHSSFLVHGITDEEVADAPKMPEVLPKFLEFVGDCTYVAHNALFDYSFINEAMKEHLGQKFTNPRIDTFEMYRSVFPDDPSHGLSSLLARFKFPPEVKHRALDDTLNLARVYPKLKALYDQKYAWQLSQLENIPYLVERYQRIQKAVQAMQAEMADLRDIFKLHFQQGGASVESTSGETMVSNYRRTYSYNEAAIWEIALEEGIHQNVFKLNPRAVDKLIDKKTLSEERRGQLIDARLSMNESRSITFLKPADIKPTEPTPEDYEES